MLAFAKPEAVRLMANAATFCRAQVPATALMLSWLGYLEDSSSDHQQQLLHPGYTWNLGLYKSPCTLFFSDDHAIETAQH